MKTARFHTEIMDVTNLREGLVGLGKSPKSSARTFSRLATEESEKNVSVLTLTGVNNEGKSIPETQAVTLAAICSKYGQ